MSPPVIDPLMTPDIELLIPTTYPERFKDYKFETIQHLVEDLHITAEQIPPNFLRVGADRGTTKTHQPLALDLADSIPVLDMEALTRRELLAAVGRAFEDWGFCTVVNHGIPVKLMEDMRQATRAFYELPLEEKMRWHQEGTIFKTPVYFGGGIQNDWRDILKVTNYPRKYADTANWPQIAGWRETAMKYGDQANALVQRLVGITSEALGLETDHLANVLGPVGDVIISGYYPVSPDPDITMGARPHADSNLIALVDQDEVGGLQVLKDGFWTDCKPMKGAIVVNCGDILQILSNGRFQSAYHRVLAAKKRSRMSTIVLASPYGHVKIKPVPVLVTDCNPAKFPELTALECNRSFMRAKYGRKYMDELKRIKMESQK